MNRIFVLSLGIVCALLVSAQTNPYISRVLEYRPAPGQFINQNFPTYEEDDLYQDMLLKVNDDLVGKTNGLICLGAWGGYITFQFDHPIVNQVGCYDLLIYGNAFHRDGQDPEGYELGSSEPGVVYVSQDTNGDGLPNDTWYEIAGSAHSSANRNYEVTYKKVGRGHVPWTDNQGNSGRINRNQWHTQASYYPLWVEDSTMTFCGTLLPSNLYDENNAYMLEYGYADNRPNNEDGAKINLDWAVDANGNPVQLGYVDFVRVQTGVMWQGPLLGEGSTEIAGAEDLHPDMQPTGLEEIMWQVTSDKWQKRIEGGQLVIEKNGVRYNVMGQIVR